MGLMTDADLAAFNALVRPNYGDTTLQGNPNSGKLATYISRDGQLAIPRRGWIKLLPGDVLAVDATTGFPILLSAAAVASGPYTLV
jgi:hypothetical protein